MFTSIYAYTGECKIFIGCRNGSFAIVIRFFNM